MTRSLARITEHDLQRLGRLAAEDRADFFRRKPQTAALYVDRLFAVALCQGGALHYLDGKNGIKDLDVWSFYAENPIKMFPPRRRAKVDFGDAKFGVTPDSLGFIGRRVDLIGRSIPDVNTKDPIGTLRKYLAAHKTETARLLAMKAVIIIEPPELVGSAVWPAQ